MAYTMTPWGYDVDGTLPPLITREQFDGMTGGKWASDGRVDSAIAAASATIRNACGWHVAPSMPCRAVVDGDGSRTIWLRTTCLTGVSSLDVDGTEAACQWSRIGQVVSDVRVPCALQAAVVEYAAGFDAVPDDLMAVVRSMVVRSIAMSYGVTSESAGGVSVSYAQGAAYAAEATSATDSDMAALMPYRAVTAHAT